MSTYGATKRPDLSSGIARGNRPSDRIARGTDRQFDAAKPKSEFNKPLHKGERQQHVGHARTALGGVRHRRGARRLKEASDLRESRDRSGRAGDRRATAPGEIGGFGPMAATAISGQGGDARGSRAGVCIIICIHFYANPIALAIHRNTPHKSLMTLLVPGAESKKAFLSASYGHT